MKEVQKGKWIKVEDGLPEEKQSVLVFTDEGVTSAEYRSPDYDVDWDIITMGVHGCGCCGRNEPNVTHWMHLPKEPK